MYKGQNEYFERGKRDVEGWSGDLVHLVQVDSLVSEPCLSIMDGFVVRKKAADMTCSTQVKSGGKRGRPIKHSMNLYRQTTYIKRWIIALLCLCNCNANNTHGRTCTYVMAGDQSC